MHICVIGAGSLGRVYGLRLAVSGEKVSFLVRPERLSDDTPFVIEQVTGTERRDTIAEPTRVAEIPADADIVLTTVRVDQIDDRLASVLAKAPDIPIVSLTPLLPQDYERLSGMLPTPGNLFAAQAGVVAYERDGLIRYWLPKVSPTLLDSEPANETISALVEALSKAGIPAKLEASVRSSNPATTAAFFPFVLALDAAGGTADAALDRKDILKEAFAAIKETRELANRIGKVAPWAGLLLKFANPLALKMGIRLAQKASPEAVHFVELHFGQKVHEQNIQMGRDIVDLGREHGVGMPAFEGLLKRLGG